MKTESILSVSEQKINYVNDLLASNKSFVDIHLDLTKKGYKVDTMENLVEIYGTKFLSEYSELIPIRNNMFVVIEK